MKRQRSRLKATSFAEKVIFNFKSIFFRNRDIISGEELVEYALISRESEKKLLNQKKLRKLNNIYYIWDYNTEFKKLIFSYKYGKKIALSKLIAELIREEFEFVLKKERIDLVVSVPVSAKRKNERGFNQVDEILKALNVSFVQLKRNRNTKKMHKILDEDLRIENVRNSFIIDKGIDFSNKNILLVDDIITTGATLREIRRSIEGGSRKVDVSVFCLAAAREIKINKGAV